MSTLYRLLVDRRARRTSSTAITHSGGCRTVFGCVCGATHTTATRYRGRTRHEREFHAAHASHMADAVIAALPANLATVVASTVRDPLWIGHTDGRVARAFYAGLVVAIEVR